MDEWTPVHTVSKTCFAEAHIAMYSTGSVLRFENPSGLEPANFKGISENDQYSLAGREFTV